jgi:hypothetical protein
VQAWPLTHWLLEVQLVKQAPVDELHVYGTQMRVEPVLQWPRPSQTEPPTTASPSQVPPLHIVFSGHLRQAPAPSQVPSKLQLDSGILLHVVASRGLSPDLRITHLPIVSGALQVLHPSVHADSQQTPSAQK